MEKKEDETDDTEKFYDALDKSIEQTSKDSLETNKDQPEIKIAKSVDSFAVSSTISVSEAIFSKLRNFSKQDNKSEYLKTSSKHNSAKIFQRLKQIQQFSVFEQPSPVWCLKSSFSGKFIALGGQGDFAVRIYSVSSCLSLCREYKGHTADVLDLSFSKNDFLLSSSMDKTVRLWHLSRNDCLRIFQHADFVTSVAFHPKDDRFFLSGSLDCRIRLWNIPERKLDYWHELPENNLVTAVAFTIDGKIAIAGSYLGSCIFYETDGLKYNTQIQVKSSKGKNSKGEKITGIVAMPGTAKDDAKIMISSNDSRIRIYSMRDKSLFCKYKGLMNSGNQIRASFSQDTQFIISGSEDKCVYVWHTFPEETSSSNKNLSDSLTPDGVGSVSSRSSSGSSNLSNNTGFKAGGFGAILGLSRRDRNSGYERFVASNHTVTCAIFGSRHMIDSIQNQRLGISESVTEPEKIQDAVTALDARRKSNSSSLDVEEEKQKISKPTGTNNRVIICVDSQGILRVFENSHKT